MQNPAKLDYGPVVWIGKGADNSRMLKRFKSLALLTLLAFLGAQAASAQVTYDYEKEEVADLLDQVRDKVSTRQEACAGCDSKQAPIVSCSRITDDFCKALWSRENFGNLKVRDGEFKFGDSQKSNTSLVWLQARRDFIASRNRLPKDLRKRTDKIIDALAKTLNKESYSVDWDRAVSKHIVDFNKAVTDTRNERVENKHPELKTKKIKTLQDNSLYELEGHRIVDEVLDAKYLNDPRWKRIQDLHGIVVADLTKSINQMSISSAEKESRINKIKSVKLTLPYQDPMRANADSACRTSELNAFYSDTLNIMTICAGYLNSVQSTAELYFVLAHEMSHSIDPSSRARDREAGSPLSKELLPLIGMKSLKPVIQCEKWQQLLANLKGDTYSLNLQANSLAVHQDEQSQDPLQEFYDCLAPKDEIDKPNLSRLAEIGQITARSEASDLSWSAYLKLLVPSFNVQNGVRENEYFERPDLLLNNGLPLVRTTVAYEEIFAQSIACQPSAQAKEERVRQAFKDFQLVVQAKKYNELAFCTVNCPSLVSRNLSKNSDENFSDWMAGQAMNLYLERLETQAERREALASARATKCGRPSVVTEDPLLTAVGQEFSLAPHSEDRRRRLSVFNESNARLANCRPDTEPNFGKCKL